MPKTAMPSMIRIVAIGRLMKTSERFDGPAWIDYNIRARRRGVVFLLSLRNPKQMERLGFHCISLSRASSDASSAVFHSESIYSGNVDQSHQARHSTAADG